MCISTNHICKFNKYGVRHWVIKMVNRAIILVSTVMFLLSLTIPRVYAQSPFGENPISWILSLIFYIAAIYVAYLVLKTRRSLRLIEKKLGIQESEDNVSSTLSSILSVTPAILALALSLTALVLALNILASDPITAGWLVLIGFIGIVFSSYNFWLRQRRKGQLAPSHPSSAPSVATKRLKEAAQVSQSPPLETPKVISESIPHETTTVSYCRYCGSENEGDAVFCQNCGRNMMDKLTETDLQPEIFCNYCGARNKKGAVYCKRCGKKIAQGPR